MIGPVRSSFSSPCDTGCGITGVIGVGGEGDGIGVADEVVGPTLTEPSLSSLALAEVEGTMGGMIGAI